MQKGIWRQLSDRDSSASGITFDMIMLIFAIYLTPYVIEPHVFYTPNAPLPNSFVPQAVIAGNLIFVSGTVGTDPSTGKLISDNYEAQVVQAFKNVKTILEDAGSSMDKVVKITVFMVAGHDPDFSITNKVYSDFSPVLKPARSGPQVMPFPYGILFSVECIAVI
jgi:2-iminobutanoate/2-iminopropanoate deaminase